MTDRAAAEVAAPLPQARGYLDTPSMGLPPASTIDAMRVALEQWASGSGDYSVWERAMEDCRGLSAQILGVESGEVGLVPSVVPAVSAVAATIARGSGVVVAHRQEFRSLLLPVLALVGEERMRWVSGPYVAGTFTEAVDERTAAVVVSAVSSHDGGRPSLARLAEACAAVGARLVIDGTQAAGIVVPDVALPELALFACAGYKGLRGPRGAAYAVARDDAVAGFAAPSSYGVADSVERGTYGPPFMPKPGAPGLDQSPSWLAWVGAQPALAELARQPAGDREHHVADLSGQLRRELRECGLEPQPTDLPSPIVTFASEDPGELVARLGQAGIRVTSKMGRVRIGFHVYNDVEDVERAVQVIRETSRAGRHAAGTHAP